MTRNEMTHRDDGRRPLMIWLDLGGRGKFKRHQLAGTQFFVQHCGHPTATWPWHGVRPDGSIVLSGDGGVMGRAFKCLDDAKVACELEVLADALRKPMHPLRRLDKLIHETDQIVRDIEYWNGHNLQHPPFDVEPERVMGRMARRCMDAWETPNFETNVKELTDYARQIGRESAAPPEPPV
jgi:hypothetical protein